MPGITKRKYISEEARINKKLSRILRSLSNVLPYNYNKEIILKLLQDLYPREWEELEQRYHHYKKKDAFLKGKGKKIRYNPNSPKKHIVNLPIVKHMLSNKEVLKYRANFNYTTYQLNLNKYKFKRKNIIQNYTEKIAKATELIQNVEPLYIDAFIAAYHKKGISIDEKLEVFKELQKYKSKKVIDFFYRLNDSERNNQIRNMAFKHLQTIGKYVKLRKNYKGKKKEYMVSTSEFYMTPIDLLDRIEKDSLQNKKVYDVFISHSYNDSTIIKKIIKALNKYSLNVYCDWTSDNDFLKRKLVSEYTKIVLKKRIEQSKNIIFVRTDDSLKSKWVEFELTYSKQIGKPIFCIDIKNEELEKDMNYLHYDILDETIEWKAF